MWKNEQWKAKKREPQDPGLQTKPGAPSVFHWFREKKGPRLPVEHTRKRIRKSAPGRRPLDRGDQVRDGIFEGDFAVQIGLPVNIQEAKIIVPAALIEFVA